MDKDDIIRLKLLKLAQLEEFERVREGLPHLHAYKFYRWSRKFFESREKIICLCAANQISKSSSQMRKAIHWATEPKLWPELWPTLKKGRAPGQFWYLYPTRDVATIEFEEKWRQFLPANEYKDHPQYGWDDEWDNKKIFAIHFKTGVTIYFKTYAQELEKLQSGSVYRLDCDEELDAHLFDELALRVAATDGYLSFVFTATKGQEFWRRVVETRDKLPEAEIYQISMFDCEFYEDDSTSGWTKDRIGRIIARCRSDAEVQRRVYGKFAVDEGLKYSLFSRAKNVVKRRTVPKEWYRYAGIDIGGGGSGHPSAITFVAVRPDFQKGVAYKHWRGEGELTTAQDVLQKFLEMREGEVLSSVNYDWAAKDFSTIAARSGVGVSKAEKSHEIGQGTLNSLFRNEMIEIFDEFDPLIQELCSLLENTAKNKAKDDSIDSLRYCVATIPWDWSCVTALHELPEKKKIWTQADERRSGIILLKDPNEIADEFEEWNELAGT